jgi:hypothetical protein
MAAPISKAFIAALAETFDELGRRALQRFRDDDPAGYAELFASYTPKATTAAEIFSDDRLEAICAQLAARIEKAAQNGVETVH